MPSQKQYTRIQYHVTKDTKLLFIGANPSFNTYENRVPFSGNKSLWYQMYDAGLIDEPREILKNNKSLKTIYDTKFTQVYHLGLLNIANRPTQHFIEIKQAEAMPGIKRIHAAIKKYKPNLICFIGKRTYQLFAQDPNADYGWQEPINGSKIFVMHFPLHGLWSVRVNELKKVAQEAGILR